VTYELSLGPVMMDKISGDSPVKYFNLMPALATLSGKEKGWSDDEQRYIRPTLFADGLITITIPELLKAISGQPDDAGGSNVVNSADTGALSSEQLAKQQVAVQEALTKITDVRIEFVCEGTPLS